MERWRWIGGEELKEGGKEKDEGGKWVKKGGKHADTC